MPPGLVLKNGSNTRRRTSSERPGPLSATLNSTPIGVVQGFDVHRAAVGHGVHGVENQVQHRAADHVAVGRRPQGRGNIESGDESLASNCGASEELHLPRFLKAKVCQCGSRSAAKCNRSFTVASRAVKPAEILSRDARFSGSPEIRRRKKLKYKGDGHEVVAHLVGDVRGHLAQGRPAGSSAPIRGSLSPIHRSGGSTSSRKALCVCSKRSAGFFPGRQYGSQVGWAKRRRFVSDGGLCHGK